MNTIALSNSPQSASRSWTRLIIGVLAAIVIAVFGLIVYVPNCKVEGYEFHPQSWQVRHFEFWAEPFTNTQLTGILHDTTRITIDASILSCLNKPSISDADRWDLVELQDYHLTRSVGPAATIVDILTTHKYGWSARPIQFWTTWTSNNPKKAPAFWQAAHTLTIHHAYDAVPDLLDQALVSDDEFDQSLNETMSRVLLEQAKTFHSQGKLEAAVATAKSGLQYDADNQELKNLAK